MELKDIQLFISFKMVVNLKNTQVKELNRHLLHGLNKKFQVKNKVVLLFQIKILMKKMNQYIN